MGWERALDEAKRPLSWVINPVKRARLLGARVQVCAFLITQTPKSSILLVKSVYGDWMPPQEGVGTKESLQEAFWRCLSEELGIEVEGLNKSQSVYVRSCAKLGTLKLPLDRHGERPVVDNAPGTFLEHIRVKKKKYWYVLAVVRSQDVIVPKPNETEVSEVAWCSINEAHRLIEGSARWEKSQLLHTGLNTARRELDRRQSHRR